MKKSIIFLILLASYIQACQKSENSLKPREEANVKEVSNKATQQSQVERGEFLVTVSLCHDCHSPKIMTEFGPQPDPARLLSGHPANEKVATYDPAILKDWVLFNQHFTAAVGPWGTSFSGNLTSDDSGIGLWSEAQFMRAIREGKLKGHETGRPLLPPMPWEMFSKMSDDDLKAIFAYLKSTKPVRNVVPPPVPPLAGNMQ